MVIREAVAARDEDAIWAILEPVIRAGETYPLPRDLDRESALAYWFSPGHEVFVTEDNGEIVGTYFLQANQRGGGAHVANCGYMTAPCARGRGVARAMCRHSLEHARQRGFRAMQFNFVVSSNEHAVGGLNPYFETVDNGTLSRERNCEWRGNEGGDIRRNSVEWRSSD